MELDWWTFALQAINFVVLVWLLRRFLYQPVKRVVEDRRRQTELAQAEAAARTEESEAARARFEEAREEIERERRDLARSLHHELEDERDQILRQAREEAESMLRSAREAIDQERAEALAASRGEVADLAADLAASLLRQASGSVGDEGLLIGLEKSLDDLPRSELERLHADLGAEAGVAATVVTARPLDPERQAVWRERLGARLGPGVALGFETEADILGGAELRLPHAVLRLSWADQLERAKAALLSDEAGG